MAMERPSGPLGTATQSTVRRHPPTSVRHAMSSSSLSATQVSMTAAQVVALAQEAMRNAIEETEASGISTKPRVTIDLSHKQIQKFPEEVVDIIKNELERLALSHNQISAFPSRFAECTSLRYLNVRNNVIREFPQSICQLTSLEILDLGRNKLKILPPELVKLTSLKVLSVQKNRIEALPLCIADMGSLQVLKLDGNPVRFPPKEVWQPQAMPPSNGPFQESETDDISVTLQIKRFLRQRAIMDRSETESGGEESSEGTETPRPMKRVMSGRFPIKVNGTDVPDLRSPALPRPPPIPSRSHYRGLSQQNAALRRPGVMPLTIGGNNNERLRSNSESLLQANRDRSTDRSRRMGIVSKKSDLVTVEESKSNRYSHYRGLSHGSAMQESTNGTYTSKGPASPADGGVSRSTYVRRLSSLPERKRETNSPDPIVEAAKGILYALFQIHPLIQSLLGVARDSTNKRTSLEMVFHNAITHVDELDRHIRNYDTFSEDEEDEDSFRTNENVHRACLTCVDAYMHVCRQLEENVNTLMQNGDPRYIRTLLLLMWGSTAEIHNAGTALIVAVAGGSNTMAPSAIEEIKETITPVPRDKSVTPTRERPGLGPNLATRLRSATLVNHPSHLRVATDTHAPPYMNGGRSATMTSATPRSGESFASASSGRMAGDFSEEDRIFDKIFLRLQQASDMTIKNLPHVYNFFIDAMRISTQQSSSDQPKQFWQILIQKCSIAQQTAETLRNRLSLIKLKEPDIRTQGVFWELCNAFIQAYTDLVMKVKEAKAVTNLLHPDVIGLLRPLQKVVKETGQLIQTSPWSFLAAPQSSNGSIYTTQSPASRIPLPMTPQSAALGPAVQATVPSTSHAMFNGNIYDRADTISMNTNSISSRNGTMTSMLGSNDGSMTPASMLSPMTGFPGMRYNGNGKVTF